MALTPSPLSIIMMLFKKKNSSEVSPNILYTVLSLRKYGNSFTSLETFWVVYCGLTMPPQELTFGPRNFMKES